MNISEYNKVKGFSYSDYCLYLKNKYGEVPEKYGSLKNSRSDEGLFIHHIGENEYANLSDDSVIRKLKEDLPGNNYQNPEMLCYCDYLEHLLLHILIGKETAGGKNLGLDGAFYHLIPNINNYYRFGKTGNINKAYTDVIKDDEEVFDNLFSMYNDLIKDRDILFEENRTLYLQMKYCLDTNNKALVVLGTGLGKTTTATQYLVETCSRALVICPNNIIKDSWSENKNTKDIVETITFQAFANSYKDIDYDNFGVVIVDEVHHMEADVWGKGIKYLLDNNIIKVLGLTATPERNDGVDVAKYFGKENTCKGRTVEDAITEGIIHPFSYVTAIYDTKGIVDTVKALSKNIDMKDPTCKKLIGQLNIALSENQNNIGTVLKKYMPSNRRKGIIFIKNIDDVDTAISIFKSVYPDAIYKSINSGMSDDEVEANREWFKGNEDNDKDKYLLAINMISEGAHYPDVNTLIMFRGTESYLVYTQQLGRVITLSKFDDPHAIVFDLVNNIESIRYNDKKTSKNKNKLPTQIVKALKAIMSANSSQIIVADETRDIVKNLKKLKQLASDDWEDWEIDILKKYYESEGAKGCQKRIDEEWERRKCLI